MPSFAPAPAAPSELMLGNLHACLLQQLELVREFSGLLHQEAHLLESHASPEAILACTKRKNTCLDHLSSCVHQREQLLYEYLGGQATFNLQDIATQAPTLAPLIALLLAETAKATAFNDANGLLIQNLLRQNQDALRFLANKKTVNSGLYDAQGRSKTPSTGTTTHIKAK